MTHSSALWADASHWLEAELGLHFTPQQLPDLQRGFEAAARRLGLPDGTACAERALAHGLDEDELQVLAEVLTIGETYFFRDPDVFDQLARQVLQPLIEKRRQGTRHLRLWSAACSTGEEAYSLAMLVAGLLPEWREWNIFILGTDINRAALRKAQAGAYGRWSLRSGIPPQARPFLHAGVDGRYHVDAELRRMVRFARLNLAGDAYPSAANGTNAMDLVLCRNVLIYFEPQRVQAVLERLGRSLAEDGWLVTSAIEIPRLGIPGLALVREGGLTALRPRAAVPAPSVAPRVAPRPLPAPPAAAPVVLPIPPAAAQPPMPVAERPPEPRALPRAPAAAAELAEVARGCANAGRLEEAEHLCRQAVAQDKLNAEWTYLLASILLERDDTDSAAAALQRTLYLEPDHLLARLALGSLALRQGRAETGRKHFSVALARLTGYPGDEVVQGSGGLTARELEGIIRRAEAATR